MACQVRVCECPGNDVAKLAYVAHVHATHSWIKRKSPAERPVYLLLRSHDARQALVVERRDDERMIRKPGFLDYPVDLGLAGKVRNVELAAADRFHVRQR